MLNLSIDKQLLILLNEAFDKRRLYAVTFSIISISILVVGLNWPKWYESSTTLVWNKASVLTPLLKGTAQADTGFEQSRIAKEILYSSKNLEKLIEKTDLNYAATGEKLSEREIEVLKANLRRSIRLNKNKRNNTLRISYKNTNPELAFLVVSVISNLFIDESNLNKISDSYDAYKFIEKLVNEYQLKLEGITKNINEFKGQNVELQVDTSQSVNARVGNLKGKIKSTSLQLKEANIQKKSLTEQLVIESAKRILVEEDSTNSARLIALENQLNTLRLSYTETYPDIVQIKEQIKNLKRSIEENAISRSDDGETKNTNNGNLAIGVKVKSLLSEQLQQQLSTIETTLRTLSARKDDQEKQLAFELERSGEVNLLFSRLAELSLDYNVTKKLYDQLLTKRENARISLNLENENAGSLYEIQEPAEVPLVPQGLRFLHFLLGSIILGVGMPLAIILGLLMLDPRIRHEDDIDLGDAIPVIGVISNLKNGKDIKKQRLVTIQSAMIFSFSFVALVALSLSRYYGVI